MARAALVTMLACGLAAQADDFRGRVLDARGQPIAGAHLRLELVARRQRATAEARYGLALAAHLREVRTRRAITDGAGRWRVLLPPREAALAAGEQTALVLVVEAPGFSTWRRALSTDPAAAADVEVRLQVASGLRLTLTLTAPDAVPKGFALIGRPFRLRGDETVWLEDAVPIGADGRVRYAEPARVPGEALACRPHARPDGYRVRVFAAGCDARRATLTQGAFELALAPARLGPRRVVDERSEPAPAPIEATYPIGEGEISMSFDAPLVPTVGGVAPVRVRAGAAEAVVTSWEVGDPLVVRRRDDRVALPDPPPAGGTQDLVIFDRQGQRCAGAVAYLEDACVRGMTGGAPPIGVSEADGTLSLTGLPQGVFRALVEHRSAGSAEVQVNGGRGQTLHVTLAHSPRPAEPAGRAGIAVLDLRALPVQRELRLAYVHRGEGRVSIHGMDAERGRLPLEACRRVLLEGMLPGPTTFFVRVAGGPPIVVGELVIGTEAEPPIALRDARRREFEVHVRTPDGEPAENPFLSLGEPSTPGRRPRSSELFALEDAGKPGAVRATVMMLGELWVMVHGEGGEPVPLLLPGTGPPAPLHVMLGAPR
jgi:hypothetical protein